jgi:hypothetical protein
MQPKDEEPRGKLDVVSLLYIFGGIPVIVLYMVVLFALARSCNAPA